MNYIDIKNFDIANGEGIRVSLWIAGCEHQCKGCHNPHTWHPLNGLSFCNFDMNNILKMLENNNISGITFTGGDPLYPKNREDVYKISENIKQIFPNKTQWLWTGYKWEDIKHLPIIKNLDVLIDGRYEEDKRNITLKWRGSSNQRVIDVQKSLLTNSIVLYCN